MSKKRSVISALAASFVVLLYLFALSASADSPQKAEPDPFLADSPATEDPRVGATDVSDSGAFADLEPAKKPEEKEVPQAESAIPAKAEDGAGEFFYNAAGGETVRFVAVALYGERKFLTKLLEMNPSLKGVKRLERGQRVYFDMDSARPDPRYLSKDLLARYPDPLSSRIEAHNSEKGLVKISEVLKKGETLQELSLRLYGTHRFWTEIFLLNREKIPNYDRVSSGLSLSVVERPPVGLAKVAKAAEKPVEAPVSKPQKRVEKPKPVQAKTEPALRPVVAPIAALSPPPKEEKLPMAIQKGPVVTQDPIPDTSLPPAAPMKPQAEVPKVESPSPKLEPLAQKVEPPPAALVPPVAAEKIAPKRAPPAEASASSIEGSSSNNSKFRRMLYVVLILAIGGAAFYFTRTPKRPRGDLLDIGAEASPRPKLPTKDSQKSNIG